MESSFVLLFMFTSLIVFMLSGAGLAFVLGAIAFISTILLWGPSALIVAVLNTFETMTSESLMAIPLYVLMASILQKSAIIDALYDAMETWSARLNGGLAVGTIIICTILAAMTGVVGAAVAAMGILALPSMLSRGYHPPLALGRSVRGNLGDFDPTICRDHRLCYHSANFDRADVCGRDRAGSHLGRQLHRLHPHSNLD